MKWTYRFYSWMTGLWIVLMAGAFVAVDAGVAETYVPASILPKTRGATVLVTGGSAVVGVFVFSRLRVRTWRAVGRRVGLTADGSSNGPLGLVDADQTGGALFKLFPAPDLTGAVDGRPVRVTTYSVSKGGGGDSSSGSRTYTVVEATLDGVLDESAIVTRSGEAAVDGITKVVPGQLEAMTVDDNFDVVGSGNEAFVRDALSGPARESLLELEKPAGVFVGDPTDALLSAIPDEMGAVAGLVTGGIGSKLRKNPSFDPSTVAITSKGRLLDPAELERQAKAVVTLAGAVERADIEAAVA